MHVFTLLHVSNAYFCLPFHLCWGFCDFGVLLSIEKVLWWWCQPELDALILLAVATGETHFMVIWLMRCILIDLGLFSSMSLVLANPDHPVEIRTQSQQGTEEPNSVDSSDWIYTSSRSQMTISRYAEYQISSFADVQNVWLFVYCSAYAYTHMVWSYFRWKDVKLWGETCYI